MGGQCVFLSFYRSITHGESTGTRRKGSHRRSSTATAIDEQEIQEEPAQASTTNATNSASNHATLPVLSLEEWMLATRLPLCPQLMKYDFIGVNSDNHRLARV